MKSISCIISLLFFTTLRTQAAGNADTLNIEQIAFNYFISKLDSFSMDSYSNYKFNKTRDKIYYTGVTTLFDDLVLGNFKTYTFKKKKFINAGSFNDRNYLLTCEKNAKPVSSTDKFVVRVKPATPSVQRKAGDASISISNRYFYDDHYFVRIKMEQGEHAFSSYFFVKLDAMGEPVSWVVAAEGEG